MSDSTYAFTSTSGAIALHSNGASLSKDVREILDEVERLRLIMVRTLMARLEGTPVGMPAIVCLCGSTRFRDAFEKAAKDETLAGKIVLSVGMFGHQEGLDMEGKDRHIKKGLDQLHLRKIDLATEVLVLNCYRLQCSECGTWKDNDAPTLQCDHARHLLSQRPYIGDSTRREIAYARATSKPVRYLNPIEPL